MTDNKEVNKGTKSVMLELPAKRFSLLSHAKNIDYILEQISVYAGNNPVVGYFMRRALGVREKSHQILPQELAETIKKEDKSFAYITLDKLLERKEEIEKGKYKTRDGLIIALDPSYVCCR